MGNVIGSSMIGKNVIIRAEGPGCFAGELAEWDATNKVVCLKKARRIWYWDGAASLSQLAVDGSSKPKDCKFPAPVPSIVVTNVLEIIEIMV